MQVDAIKNFNIILGQKQFYHHYDENSLMVLLHVLVDSFLKRRTPDIL